MEVVIINCIPEDSDLREEEHVGTYRPVESKALMLTQANLRMSIFFYVDDQQTPAPAEHAKLARNISSLVREDAV